MDITNESLKSMKAKQLRRIIREAIQEVLAEAPQKTTIDYKNPSQPDKILDIEPSDTTTINKLKSDSNVGSITMGNKKIKEGELDELARLAKGFRLADPEFDASQYADKRVSGASMEDIINFFRENPGAEKTALQAQFSFARPQIANAVVNGLLDAGVLVKLGAGGEVEATPEPGEEAPVQATEPEDLFMGSASNPLAMYFDNVPNDNGEEDFNDEEEPTAGELEPGEPVSTGGMSDEDYEAFMQYSDLADRLAATKSNLLKLKRRKGGTAGDISDRPSNEEARLRDLKDRLQKKVDDLVAGSKYLQKKIEKQTGKAYEPVEAEPEEEDTIDEAYDAEYEKRKLQFYAGIIK
jgi:hypothetical protein